MRLQADSHIDFGIVSKEFNIANETNIKCLQCELLLDHAAIFITLRIEPIIITPTKTINMLKGHKLTQTVSET